jgi:hypothetical protein
MQMTIARLCGCPTARGAGQPPFPYHLLRFFLLDEIGKISKLYVGNIIIWVKIEIFNPIYVSKP